MYKVYVHACAKCFSASPLLRVMLPIGYQATLTENSVLFLSLRENNIATAQVEGKWHFLTVTLKLTVLTHIFPPPWRAGNQREKPSTWKKIRTAACPKQGGLLNFILSSSSLTSQFCKAQSLWLWSSEVQRYSFTIEVAQVLQPDCMLKSFMTPCNNHTLSFCSLFARIMQIMLLFPLLECNRKTHWVSLCLLPQTSNLLKGCSMLSKQTSGRHKRCPR